MKRIFTFFLAMMLMGLGVNYAQNCVTDSSFTGFGFSPPDSLLPCLEQSVPYDTTITVNVPNTLDLTAVIGFPVSIDLDSIDIDTILNFPSGVSYTCEPPTCKWNGGDQGCIRIQGTTNDPIGPYVLDIIACTYVSNLPQIPGFPLPSDTSFCGSTSQAPGGQGFGLTLQVTSQGGPCPCLFPDLGFTFTTAGTTATFVNTSALADSTWWDFGDGTTDDGLVTTHEYDLTNQFAFNVTLYGSNGCGTDSTTQTVLFPTGIQPLEINANLITVFPNPNTGDFTVRIENYFNVQEDVAITLTNLQGKEVYNNVLQLNGGIMQQPISLNTVSNGVYFLAVRSENFSTVKKVVIR